MRKSKLLSILLSICMVVTWMPAGVWADTNEGGVSSDLQSNEASTHSDHPICGASCSHGKDAGHNLPEDKTWTGVSDLSKITEAGYYYLTDDVILTDTWKPANDVVLCLNGKTITETGNYSAIEVESTATFTLTDCQNGEQQGKVTHDNAQNYGVYVNSGMFNMYNGKISGNSGINGGGVFIQNNGKFNMFGGEISNNSAGNGGGAYVGSGAFTMTGGSITGNTATTNGGGVYVNSGMFVMTGGSISQNIANSTGDGGGVFVNYNGTFNMSDSGLITGNTAYRGGGVCVDRTPNSNYYKPGNFMMSSGTIKDNNATYGGGVYVSGKFTMSSGEISSNKATGKAGGVYVNDDSEFKISGAPKITNNTLNNNITSNAYLTDPPKGKTGVTITISSALTNGANIGVTLAQGHSETIATGANNNDLQYFHSDGSYSFVLDSDNIKLSNGTTPTPQAHEHPICGKTCSHTDNDKHTNVVSWVGVSNLDSIMAGTAENPNYYYLTNNVTITTATEAPALDSSVSSWKMYYGWDAPDNVVLCLNGYDITMENPAEYTSKNVDVIRITGNFTLTDCQSAQGKITHTAQSKGRGAYVLGGTFNMYGGQITRNTTQQYSGGGGVCIGGIQDTNRSSVFNLYGGSITHNTAGIGGGVKVSRIVWYGPSQFNMYGGSITDNTATVTDETPNSYGVGGGVYVSWTATCKMSGGTITGNTAKFDGAGVYLSALARSYENDNGKAAKFEIFGSPSITGNTVNDKTSNVCLESHTADNNFETVDSSITISRALSSGANIGVTLAQGHRGTIATGAISSDLQYFHSDGDYLFRLDGNNIKLSNGTTHEHIHDWKYVVDGATITATCNNTDNNCTSPNGGSITISAPTNLTYDGNAKAATLNGSISALTTTPDITYKQSGNTLSGAPTNAGTYTASITVEGVTASVTYTITTVDKPASSGGHTKNTDVITTGDKVKTTTSPAEVKTDGADTATAAVSKANQEEILKQAKDNKSSDIVLDISDKDTKGADNIQLELPKSMIDAIANDTAADLTINTEHGKLTVDKDTLDQLSKDAKGSTLRIIITKIKEPTAEQQKLAGDNVQPYRLTIMSGNQTIGSFAGKITVRLPIPEILKDKTVAAAHFDSDGKLTEMPGKRMMIDGIEYYVFETTHFSEFGLVDAVEAGFVKTDDSKDKVKEAKSIVSKMNLTAVTSKTTKKNVKVTVTMNKKTSSDIKALKELGYTVKYRFYRSTKKSAGYKSKITKKTNTYINTAGKKGTRYYYKAQVRVYDSKGKLITTTALKQCSYGTRTWSK